MTQSENNKRIAKNTLLLYFRMLLMMGVSLYTIRVVLNTLGAVDYGIYNVVGGVVTMFSFLSGTMAGASQRFFAFEIGRKDYQQLKKTFSMTMTIYVMIAVVILILAETIGLWFLNNKMTIPAERMESANWIYQFAILSFILTMFAIPYNAAIIAHERMNVYAYVSIIEVTLKLAIVYILVVFSFDKLKLYAVLMFAVTAIVTSIYQIYCRKKFDECRFSFYWNKSLFKEIVSYSGWNLFGALAGIFSNQGISIVLNMFFGPVVNAAQAIATQVNNTINQFIINFSTAVNPQITKYYAAGEKEEMIKLVFQSSKFSYFLMFILSMPVLLETNFILSMWLKEVPDYVVIFTQLVIITALIDSLSQPLITSLLATGKIRNYQLIVGGIRLLNLPVSYCFLKFGFPPQTVMYIAIGFAVLSLTLRLLMSQNMLGFPVGNYISNVIIKIIVSSIIAYCIPLWIIFKWNDDNPLRFVIILATGLASALIFIYFLGLLKSERVSIKATAYKQIITKIPFIKGETTEREL